MVYFAGYGAPNPETGEGFILPYSGDPAYTDETAFPLKKLYAHLDGLPTKDVTVLLDACFSGRGSGLEHHGPRGHGLRPALDPLPGRGARDADLLPPQGPARRG
ncbi:MAG: hypothetical protein HY924_13095 [Elusimicrobia bacterium]|nr:hypothetical protein [Elusimicrobiota bacterium]